MVVPPIVNDSILNDYVVLPSDHLSGPVFPLGFTPLDDRSSVSAPSSFENLCDGGDIGSDDLGVNAYSPNSVRSCHDSGSLNSLGIVKLKQDGQIKKSDNKMKTCFSSIGHLESTIVLGNTLGWDMTGWEKSLGGIIARNGEMFGYQ